MAELKFCPQCGKKLAQPNPKYCPSCGSPVKAAKVFEPKAAGKPQKPISPKEMLARAGVAIVLIVLFVFIAFYLPGFHWQRAEAAGTQYYSYLTRFSNDLNDLNALSKSYADVQLNNNSISMKAWIAGNYAMTAKQAVTSWTYFNSFLTQNEGLLADWNVDVKTSRGKIETVRTAVKNEVQLMTSELQPFADKERRVASALEALKEIPN
ncbi:hypothetical protein H0N96_03645 [Candidatus Micrarchaeota archaeon]|nr:hypothetical protein [Candidatus Micrarchaeota archaeon]